MRYSSVKHIEEVEILIGKSGDTGVSPSSCPSLSSSALMMLDTELMSVVATLFEERSILSPTSISFWYKKSAELQPLPW